MSHHGQDPDAVSDAPARLSLPGQQQANGGRPGTHGQRREARHMTASENEKHLADAPRKLMAGCL